MNKIIIKEEKIKNRNIIAMKEMKPLEIGRLPETGAIVMRGPSTQSFQVIRLSNAGVNGCWDNDPSLEVELLPNATITVNLNE